MQDAQLRVPNPTLEWGGRRGLLHIGRRCLGCSIAGIRRPFRPPGAAKVRRLAAQLAAAWSVFCSPLSWSAELRADGRAYDVLDRAVASLAASDADVRRVLTSAMKALPPDSPLDLRQGLETFLSRLPDHGQGFRCGAEFLRYRALRELFHLIELARGEASEPVGPRACYATPFAVDAAAPPGQIEIYGFDLDRVELELILVGKQGFREVPNALVRHSHTHLTVKLGSGGVVLSQDSDLLGLAWGHILHYSIPVVRADTPLCRTHIESVPEKALAFEPDRMEPMAEERPATARARAFAMLDFEMNLIEATLCLSVPGKTPRGGCSVQYVQTIAADRIVEGFVEPRSMQLAAAATDAAVQPKLSGPRGPVIRWSVDSGQKPGLVGPALKVQLGPLHVAATDKQACISAIDFLEARRVGALTPTTIRRLAPQLARVPEAIRRIRPRFAPGLAP